MPKSARAAKLPPIVPSRQGSSGATEESGSRGKSVLSFPLANRLIITTKKGVYIWDAYGITEVFRSGSEGIVAAKKIVIGNDMLAVADSQVVVLHDIGGGLQRSYRLKGSDVGSSDKSVLQSSTDNTPGPSQAVEVCQRVEESLLHNYATEFRPVVLLKTLQTT